MRDIRISCNNCHKPITPGEQICDKPGCIVLHAYPTTFVKIDFDFNGRDMEGFSVDYCMDCYQLLMSLWKNNSRISQEQVKAP